MSNKEILSRFPKMSKPVAAPKPAMRQPQAVKAPQRLSPGVYRNAQGQLSNAQGRAQAGQAPVRPSPQQMPQQQAPMPPPNQGWQQDARGGWSNPMMFNQMQNSPQGQDWLKQGQQQMPEQGRQYYQGPPPGMQFQGQQGYPGMPRYGGAQSSFDPNNVVGILGKPPVGY